jgi:hypothetical protein
MQHIPKNARRCACPHTAAYSIRNSGTARSGRARFQPCHKAVFDVALAAEGLSSVAAATLTADGMLAIIALHAIRD